MAGGVGEETGGSLELTGQPAGLAKLTLQSVRDCLPKKKMVWTGEMTQQLRIPAALAEGLDSVLHTHVVVYSCL